MLHLKQLIIILKFKLEWTNFVCILKGINNNNLQIIIQCLN